jgi:subtilisin family serine protease
VRGLSLRVRLPAATLLCACVAVAGGVTPASAASDGPEQRVLVAAAGPSTVDDVAAAARRAGAQVEERITAASVVTVSATPGELTRLASSEHVVAVVPDVALRPELAESEVIVNANTTTAKGLDGSGRAVVVIDSGVQSDHEFLGGRVVDGACFSVGSNCPNGDSEQLGVAAGEPCTFNVECFHGTHVAGIIAGDNGTISGVAPDATILSINVGSADVEMCDGEPCLTMWLSDLLLALEQVYTWRSTYDIAAVNMSLGGGLFAGSHCDAYGGAVYMKPLVQQLRDVGIPTVVASGNDGSSSAVSFPACLSNVVAVGSVTKSGSVAGYSNSSSALDVLAPGSSITSAVPTSVAASGYGIASGTSMAAPHVAGAFAALDELLPTASLSTKQYRVVSTGVLVTDSRNGIRKYRLKLSADKTPPNTYITSHPASTVTAMTVSFRFTSEKYAVFQCKVDAGSWKSCTSPRAVSVSKGTHRFYVRGRDRSGNFDPTPASFAWRRV